MTKPIPLFERSAYFLGGADLEMQTIGSLLRRSVPLDRINDKRLRWGAKASDYATEIMVAERTDLHIVCVELLDDLIPNAFSSRITWIDHHDTRAGANVPTSLEQAFAYLQRPSSEWTREYQLVSANDRGHIAGMQAVGATEDEIKRIRAADRAAQGITADEERMGLAAASRAEHFFQGRLTVVQSPHSRTATITDALHPALGGCGYENLLVFGPEETNFFGIGTAIHALSEKFSGGWSGGELPYRGFWGYPQPLQLPATLNALANVFS